MQLAALKHTHTHMYPHTHTFKSSGWHLNEFFTCNHKNAQFFTSFSLSFHFIPFSSHFIRPHTETILTKRQQTPFGSVGNKFGSINYRQRRRKRRRRRDNVTEIVSNNPALMQPNQYVIWTLKWMRKKKLFWLLPILVNLTFTHKTNTKYTSRKKKMKWKF